MISYFSSEKTEKYLEEEKEDLCLLLFLDSFCLRLICPTQSNLKCIRLPGDCLVGGSMIKLGSDMALKSDSNGSNIHLEFVEF